MSLLGGPGLSVAAPTTSLTMARSRRGRGVPLLNPDLLYPYMKCQGSWLTPLPYLRNPHRAIVAEVRANREREQNWGEGGREH